MRAYSTIVDVVSYLYGGDVGRGCSGGAMVMTRGRVREVGVVGRLASEDSTQQDDGLAGWEQDNRRRRKILLAWRRRCT